MTGVPTATENPVRMPRLKLSRVAGSLGYGQSPTAIPLKPARLIGLPPESLIGIDRNG